MTRPPAWRCWLWVFAPILGAALLYLAWVPRTTDLAAQAFRSDLFASHGFLLWSNDWYGGNYLLGYSALFPPLAAVLGPALVGAAAAVLAAALFAPLALRAHGPHARLATLWFGVGAIAMVFSGRLTFALGIAFGTGALLALSRRRLAAAALLAAATSLSSPVAGFFLLVFAAALALTGNPRRGLALGLAALLPLAAIAIFFPVTGTEPFVASSFRGTLVVILLVLVALPREERLLRAGTALYAGAVVLAFAIPNAMGGNVVRLSNLAAGPVVALGVAGPRRRWILAALAVPLLYWQLQPAYRDVTEALDDPSTREAFFDPLLAQLRSSTAGEPVRVEVPPTQHRWEARYVAPEFPLARGWERQRESEDFDLFKGDALSADAYRRWLQSHGVSYVALANAKLDYMAEREALLIRRGLPYLRPIWSSADWRLFAIRRPAGLIDPPARVTAIGPDWIAIQVPRAGRYLLRVHYNRYWAVEGSEACVAQEGDWTELDAARAGAIRLSTRFDLGAPRGRGRSCSLS